MLNFVCSVGKGKGSTTVAMGLALCFAAQNQNVLLVEADPIGGDIALNLGLDDTLGVLSLVAAGETVKSSKTLIQHSHAVCGVERLRLCVAQSSNASLREQIEAFWALSGHYLAATQGQVVVDLGRYENISSQAIPLWLSQQLIAVCSGSASGLIRSKETLNKAALACNNLSALINACKWSHQEVLSATGIEAQVLTWDSPAANAIWDLNQSFFRRSQLYRELNSTVASKALSTSLDLEMALL